MKVKYFLFFLVAINLVFLGTLTSSQNSSVMKQIENAIRELDSGELSKRMGNTITITIDKNTKIYSRKQGVSVLTNYLKKNHHHNFTLLYVGNRNNSIYGVGHITQKSKRINVLIFLEYEETKKKYLLNEIKFE